MPGWEKVRNGEQERERGEREREELKRSRDKRESKKTIKWLGQRKRCNNNDSPTDEPRNNKKEKKKRTKVREKQNKRKQQVGERSDDSEYFVVYWMPARSICMDMIRANLDAAWCFIHLTRATALCCSLCGVSEHWTAEWSHRWYQQQTSQPHRAASKRLQQPTY